MQISEADLDAIFAGGDTAIVGGMEIQGHLLYGSDAAIIYGVEIEAVKPAFNCKYSDISDISRGASVTINGDTFTVEKIQKIGNGTGCIYLKT